MFFLVLPQNQILCSGKLQFPVMPVDGCMDGLPQNKKGVEVKSLGNLDKPVINLFVYPLPAVYQLGDFVSELSEVQVIECIGLAGL